MKKPIVTWTHRTWAALMTSMLLPALAASCGTAVNSGGGGGAGGGSGALKWYTTCGAPVCDPNMSGSSPACTTEKAGDPCTKAGTKCGLPAGSCGADLLCATSDPKQNGCPVSLASYKHDIRYLPEDELQRVHDDIVSTPLASWRYNHEGASGREHLGFLIDDNPNSPKVAGTGDQVDLYGYTSMTVAAIQVQAKQIAALERETKALREDLAAMRRACGDGARRPASAGSAVGGSTLGSAGSRR